MWWIDFASSGYPLLFVLQLATIQMLRTICNSGMGNESWKVQACSLSISEAITFSALPFLLLNVSKTLGCKHRGDSIGEDSKSILHWTQETEGCCSSQWSLHKMYPSRFWERLENNSGRNWKEIFTYLEIPSLFYNINTKQPIDKWKKNKNYHLRKFLRMIYSKIYILKIQCCVLNILSYGGFVW